MCALFDLGWIVAGGGQRVREQKEEGPILRREVWWCKAETCTRVTKEIGRGETRMREHERDETRMS